MTKPRNHSRSDLNRVVYTLKRFLKGEEKENKGKINMCILWQARSPSARIQFIYSRIADVRCDQTYHMLKSYSFLDTLSKPGEARSDHFCSL